MPALRYRHLFDQATLPEGRALVVLLTHSAAESLGILQLIIEAPRGAFGGFTAVVAKAHQDIGAARMRALVSRRWPGARELSWYSGSVAEALRDAAIVVSAGTSAAVEAICRGVPVILAGRRAGVALNSLEAYDVRLWQVVYDLDEFAAALDRWKPSHPLSPAERAAAGLAVRDQAFTTTTPATMRAFLPTAWKARAK